MKLAIRQSGLGYLLTTADIRLQALAAGAGLQKRYFDFREGTRGRFGKLDLSKHAEAGAIFIHIPKCGGTSIEEQVPFHTGHRSIIYYYASDRRLTESLFKFTIVRNPYDRLVSGFHWLRFHTKGHLGRKWVRDNIAQFDDFSAFMEALQNRSFRNAIRSWVLFAPQWYFVCDGSGTVLVDYVGRLEKFDEAVEFVNERTNLKLTNMQVRTSKRQHYSTYFTKKDEGVVLEMYGRDFDIFGYDRRPLPPS